MDIKQLKRYVVDTETSAQKGVPLWHPKNRVIQISCYRKEDDAWFDEYINYGPEFYLHPDNVAIHKIGVDKLQKLGKPIGVVLQDFLNFVGPVEDEEVLLFAHNAPFDFDVILKALETDLGECYGENANKIRWNVFDTLHFFKDRYPDLAYCTPPDKKPYSLGKLCETFLNAKVDTMHNAKTDVVMLNRLLEEVVIPNIGTDWKKYVVRTDTSSKRLKLMKHVSGFGDFRVEELCNTVNRVLAKDPEYSKYMTTNNLFMVVHLILFGKMMLKLHASSSNNDWWEICKHVEILLREKPVSISSDNTIATVLSLVCGVSYYDFVFHTMKEDGNKDFFPPLRGTRRAFYPLKITDEEAFTILRDTGWGTIGEIMADMLTSTKTFGDLVRELKRCLAPTEENAMQLLGFEKKMKEEMKYW